MGLHLFLSLSPKILSLSSRVLLPLHLIHTNTAALENAPKLSSKRRKRDTEKRRREKRRERISRTISSTQTLSCLPVIKVLSSGARKVPLRCDDCWGRERERLTLYAVCHCNNSDTLRIIKPFTFFQMDHLNLLTVVIMHYMTIRQNLNCRSGNRTTFLRFVPKATAIF